jgi:hypothetical protein
VPSDFCAGRKKAIVTSMALARPERFRIGRVLSESFAVIGRNFWLCCLLVLIFRLLPQFVLSFCAWTIFKHGVPDTSAEGIAFEIVSVLTYPGLFGMLQVAVAFLVIEDWRGRRPTLLGCAGVAWARLLPALGVWLLSNELFRIGGRIGGNAIEHYEIDHYVRLVPSRIPFALIDGIFLVSLVPAFIPGLVLWARWFAAIPALVDERQGVFRSLARSRDLTSGSRWPLAGYWFAAFVASVLIDLVSRHWVLPFGIGSHFFSDVAGTAEPVVTAAVMAVSYFEFRRIREDTGVEDLAEIFE